MTHVGNSDGLGKSRQEINHNNEPHRETTEAAQLLQENKFAKIVHSRVDPATTLRQKDLPVIGSNSEGMCVADELRLESREVFKQERC